MKNLQKTSSILRGMIAGAAIMACIPVAKANPYASQLTNTSGTISFCLNENATDVSIVYGANAATNDLGALTKGFHSFSLTYLSVNYTTYAIQVFNVGGGSITETSSDSNPLNTILSGSGNLDAVTVNTNPATGNFGRIYLGTRHGAGFFVRNADQSDAIGQGATALVPTGMATYLNAGASSFDSRMMSVGPGDIVNVGSATTVANGFWLANMDPNLATFSLVLSPAGNNGGIMGAPIITGSTNNGNLLVTAMDYSYGSGLSLLQWNIGSGPLPADTVTPTALGVSGLGNFQTVSDGFVYGTNFYTFVSRSSPTSPGLPGSLEVFNAVTGSATPVWASFNNSIQSGFDLFASCVDAAIAPNGQFVVAIDEGTSYLKLCNLDQNGIPIETTLFTNAIGTTAGSSYGQVSFDIMGNMYEATQGAGLYKVFSPGQTTLATTANDTTVTNGTFTLTFPTASISTTASIPTASQNTSPNNTGAGPAIPGQFTITRTGGLTGQSLTVYFMLEGTATNPVYTATAGASTFSSTNGAGHYVTNSVTIAAGQLSTNITITPAIDGVPRLTTTVTLNIFTNASYNISVGGAPVVDIVNTAPQALEVTGVGTLVAGAPTTPSMYKGLTNDYASFVITRLGDTNNGASYTVNNFTYSGTATVNVDFTPPARTTITPLPYQYDTSTELLALGGGVTINPGDVNVVATVSPLPTSSTYTGNKTVSIGVAAGSGYTVASSSTATLTLIDNADPVSPVLFADPLTNTLNVNNNDGIATWNILFANTNFPCVPDYTAAFGYTLATDGIGLPPNGATTALKMTVNKNGNGASAGVNAYPTNFSFSGNYAMRFNMMLVEGDTQTTATEFAMFGINNSGLATNWVPFDDTVVVNGTTYPWGMDGITYMVDAQFSGTTLGDYLSVTGEGLGSQYGYVPLALGAAGSGTPGTANQGGRSGVNYAGTTMKDSYDYPPGPYTEIPFEAYYVSGLPANAASVKAPTTWADVEIKQINNVVTFSVNKTMILSYTNTNSFTAGTGPFSLSQAGTVMLGYNDPYASIGSADAAVYYSNLRVVRISPIIITSITLSGGNVVIEFTSSDGDDTTSSFTLLSGTTGLAVDTAVAGASFSQMTSGPSAGTFVVTTPKPANGIEFYRIKHN